MCTMPVVTISMHNLKCNIFIKIYSIFIISRLFHFVNKIHCPVPPSLIKCFWEPSFLYYNFNIISLLLDLLFWPTYGYSFFVPSTDMSEEMADSIISPSDGYTSEEEEFTKIMSTNNATVVENVDETSNSWNSNYTKLVSISLTTASIQCKYMCIFLHYLNFTKYNLLIHHNAILITFNYISWVGAMEITQILILILLFKPQLDHVHL